MYLDRIQGILWVFRVNPFALLAAHYRKKISEICEFGRCNALLCLVKGCRFNVYPCHSLYSSPLIVYRVTHIHAGFYAYYFMNKGKFFGETKATYMRLRLACWLRYRPSPCPRLRHLHKSSNERYSATGFACHSFDPLRFARSSCVSYSFLCSPYAPSPCLFFSPVLLQTSGNNIGKESIAIHY